MSTPSTVEVRPLADLSHTILLAGAGKMGGALLQGWLALGLSPEKVAVIEAGSNPASRDSGSRFEASNFMNSGARRSLL